MPKKNKQNQNLSILSIAVVKGEVSFKCQCATVDLDCPGILHHGSAVGSLHGDRNLSCLWETGQEAVLQSQLRLQENGTTGWLLGQLCIQSAQ